jgi:hypothetical protein
MKKYLALCPNTPSETNIIFEALNFEYAKNILKTKIKKDTMYQDVTLIELDTLKTKTYFIEKI